MVFYYNEKGEPLAIIPERINQGSVGSKKVFFVCSVNKGNAVNVSFINSIGEIIEPFLMTPLSDPQILSGASVPQTGYNVWVADLPSVVVAKEGTAKVQFFVDDGEGNRISTPVSDIFVEKGIEFVEPTVTDSYAVMLEQLVRINNSLNAIKERVSTVEENTSDLIGIDTLLNSVEERVSSLEENKTEVVGGLYKHTLSLVIETLSEFGDVTSTLKFRKFDLYTLSDKKITSGFDLRNASANSEIIATGYSSPDESYGMPYTHYIYVIADIKADFYDADMTVVYYDSSKPQSTIHVTKVGSKDDEGNRIKVLSDTVTKVI